MKFVTENFLLAISIFFIGTLLSIILSKVSKIFFKKISTRTKTTFDDFIFEVCKTADREEFKEIRKIIMS